MFTDKNSFFSETVCQTQCVMSAYECCEFMQEKVLEVKQLLQLEMQNLSASSERMKPVKGGHLIPSWLCSDTQSFEIM